MDNKETIDDYMARMNLNENRKVWENNHPKIDYILNKSIRYIKEGMRTTEIGIGDSYLMQRLCDMNIRYTGIDISSYLIDYHLNKLEGKEHKVHLINKNIATQDGFKIAKQDAFFCIDILEHLSESEYQQSIINIHSMLKENGIFVGSFPYNENLEKSMVFCPDCGNTFHRVGHQHSIDFQKLRKSFSGRFNIVEFGNVLKPFRKFVSDHLKDMLSYKIRKYVPGGTVYFIAERCR